MARRSQSYLSYPDPDSYRDVQDGLINLSQVIGTGSEVLLFLGKTLILWCSGWFIDKIDKSDSYRIEVAWADLSY